MHFVSSTSKRRRRKRSLLFSAGMGPALAVALTSVVPASAVENTPSMITAQHARYVRLVEAPATTPVGASGGVSPGSFGASAGAGLQRAMNELTNALSDSRRILEGDNMSVVGKNLLGGDNMRRGRSRRREEDETSNSEDEDNATDGVESQDESEKDEHSDNRRPSSDWWERMYQGGPLYDEWTGKLIEETKEVDGITSRPANRRSHSAAVYRQPVHTSKAGNNNAANEEAREWMIVSGGFTDEEWDTFPVWAYDLTDGRSIAEIEDDLKRDLFAGGKPNADKTKETLEKLHDPDIAKAPWVDLTQLSSGDGEEVDVGLGQAPQGRVGHLSSVYKDCLYIFGGLTYRMGTFHVDYADDEGENSSIAIWKACGLDKLLGKDDANQKVGGLKWERVVANINASPPAMPPDDDSLSDDFDEDENTDGDDHATEEAGSEINGDDRSRRRTQRVPWSATPRHDSHRNNAPDTITTPPQQTLRIEAIKPAVTLPRGEAQGGDYPASHNHDKDCFVFYGGMHHHHSLTETSLQATTILGDVWSFEYETETLRLLSPYPPLPWQRDDRNLAYPKARTAHAGTIVGDELIIHGGMHFGEEDVEDKPPSSFSSPSNTYATYKTTSSSWQALSDVWVFNLKTLQWRERLMYPQLARSYHSMVGWGNGTVAAFGGFQQDNNIPRETIAFVFKDLLVSRPNETYWQKLQPPIEDGFSTWHSSAGYTSRPGITNRLEHTAVLDQNGSMYVYGGRFQTVRQIVGLWRLDVFTKDARLRYEVAPPDGIDQYEAELEALHMFIATMMFMSLTISSIFSMMRRQAAEGEGGGGGGGRTILGRRGLSRQVIDSLPLKRYEAVHTDVTEDGDVVEDVSLSRENSRDESSSGLEENLDCCAICLVPYEDGVSEIRTLPCGHVFDRECIDAWFADHTTCPSCRSNIAETSSHHEEEDTTIADAINEQYEFDPRFRFLTAFDGSSRRRHDHWNDGAASLGGLRHSHWNTRPEVLPADTDVTSQNSNEETPDSHEHGHGAASMRPSFLSIRRLFNRRGHNGVAVPSDEEAVNNPSIELV